MEPFFPRQSSSDVLLASQESVHLAKIKAASCIMSGGGGIDPGPFAVVGVDKSEVQRESLGLWTELDNR